MGEAICKLICENVTDDTLNQDFHIEDSTGEIGIIRWAPGALDGVTIYHVAPSDLDEEGASEMADAVKCASEGDYQETDNRFAEWCKEHRAVSNIDRLQKYVMEHADQLDMRNIGATALRLVMCSEHIECVKIGLELLELFGEPVEDIKDVIRTVGLYDEFTIFAVWNMQKWTDGNEEIFRLAKKTNGWGRIHAVERLEPETDEIRKWLLTEGTKNSVQNAYSALTCWKKSNAEELLQDDISDEEFNGIATIIEGLLDEGPVSGISEVEHSKEILLWFLRQAEKHGQAADIVRSVKDWMKNKGEKEAADNTKRENTYILIRLEQMKQIARYELTFDKISADDPEKNGGFSFSEKYSYTLDDLKQALMNLRKANPTIEEFYRDWYYPLDHMKEAFGLDRARGRLEDEDDTPAYLSEYAHRMLPLSDSAYFDKIWSKLNPIAFWLGGNRTGTLSEVFDFDKYLNEINRYERNKGKPIEEWEFSKEEKEGYVSMFEVVACVKISPENQLILCRKYIDELCKEDSEVALRVKGYACYGGNRLYPCDWDISRDCITRLYDKTEDPQYANTLGYIYYYGRCNEGVPEYDKAFHYFTIAAINGVREGMYKLADMYWHGYGCKKSPRNAYNLYERAYHDSYEEFLEGEDANFADVALRMGNVYAKGIYVEENPEKAYYYYLQADYAARQRAKYSDFFGDATVAINAQNALAEAKARLWKNYFEIKDYHDVFLFEMLMSGEKRCELKRSEDSDGNIVLTATRVVTQEISDWVEVKFILLTVPELQYCERVRNISYAFEEHSEVWFKENSNSVEYDYFEDNWDKGRLEFYYDYELVAYVVRGGRYWLLIDKKPESCDTGVQ